MQQKYNDKTGVGVRYILTVYGFVVNTTYNVYNKV